MVKSIISIGDTWHGFCRAESERPTCLKPEDQTTLWNAIVETLSERIHLGGSTRCVSN